MNPRGPGSTALQLDGLWFSAVVSVAKGCFLDVRTALICGDKDKYLT